MKKAHLFISIFLLVIALGCKRKPANQKFADDIFDRIPESTKKNLNVGKKNYVLAIPKGWTTKRQTYRGIDYYFLLAPKTKADPNTSINLVTEYMQNMSLAEYKASAFKAIEKIGANTNILDNGEIEANGLKGIWYSFTLKQSEMNIGIVSYIFQKNGIAYVITAGTQLKDAPRYRTTFDSVARSLDFRD